MFCTWMPTVLKVDMYSLDEAALLLLGHGSHSAILKSNPFISMLSLFKLNQGKVQIVGFLLSFSGLIL